MSESIQAGDAELAQMARCDLDALWSRLCRARDCIEYCHDRTVDLLDRKDGLAQLAFHRAGLVMGRDSDAARNVVRLMKRKGGYDGANRWLKGPPALAPLFTSRPSLELLGCVYTARVRAYPHVLKIGFSACPERRMRELEYSFGQAFDLEDFVAGTPLDEVRAHIDAGRRYIKREFVFDPSFTDIRPSNVPDFIWTGTERALVKSGRLHALALQSGSAS